MTKRIGILTSGGDCPGLNAVIRAVVHRATGYGWQVLGIKEGTAIAFLGMTWDLKAPVLAGDTIHVYQRVEAVRPTSNPLRGIVNFWLEVRNQKGQVCQEGIWKVMFHARPTTA